MTRYFAVVALAGLFMTGSQAFGVSLGQVDDFNDGTLQNWMTGGINPNPPVNVADAGQGGVGDHVMLVTSNGELGGPGAQPTVFNGTQWTGDFIAAGITELSFDINNIGDNPVHPGLEIKGAGGNIFSLVGATVPAQSGWVNVTISLDPSNFVLGDPALTLSGVTELRLREIIGGTVIIPGVPTAAYYDNITAAPEPASLALLGMGGLAMLRRR